MELQPEVKQAVNEGLLAAIFGEKRPCYPYILREVDVRLTLAEAVEAALNSLPLSKSQKDGQLRPRMKTVLELRFGLEDGKQRTLRQVAQELGVKTAERIRQWEAKALRMLRHPSRSKELKNFLVPTPEELLALESKHEREKTILEKQIADLKDEIAQMKGQPDQASLKKDKEALEEAMRRFPNNRVWNAVRRSLWRRIKALRHPQRGRRIEGLSDLIELVESGDITGLWNIGSKGLAFLQEVIQTLKEEQRASPE